jgi:hypothetical protein
MRFTAETRNLIIAGVRSGMGFERAARSARVDPSTAWRWRQRGEQDRLEGRRTAYAAFADAYAGAEAESVAQLEVSIHEQAQTDWRANAWLLSRRRPQEYAEKVEVVDSLRKQVVDEMFGFLRFRASPATFNEVCELLSQWGDAELDAKVLPCPG